ncbi:MAG: hypothetical protein MK096_14570 [Oleiphilaceae bacterium]|nr:hypothetical protein [Oleiphilaceae bacterium]
MISYHFYSFIYLACLIGISVGIENVSNQNLFWGPLHDSAHTYILFFLTLLLSHLARAKDSGLKLIQVGGFCFIIGIAIELSQPFFQRSASFIDIYYNFIGICSAILIIVSTQRTFKKKIIVRFFALFLLFSAMFVPAHGAYTLYQRQAELPSLLNFEHAWQMRLYRPGDKASLSLVSKPKGWDNPSTTLKVDFATTTYPGFSVPHIHGDWSDFNQFRIDIFSKSDTPQKLTLRIHDKTHNHEYVDRFNRSFEIQKGVNKISIPLSEISEAPQGRAMDMKHIQSLALFSAKPEQGFSLYFDNLRLD